MRSFRRLLAPFAAAWLLVAASAGAQAADGSHDSEDRPSKGEIVIESRSERIRLEGSFEPVERSIAQNRRAFRSGRERARAVYTPAIKQAGYYEIYLWWPDGVPGAGAADVVVHHAKGIAHTHVDQSVLAGQWNSVGIHELQPGAAIHVVSRPGNVLVVDALRLKFLGSQPPALVIADPAIPILNAESPLDIALRASGGRPPYRWSVVQGELPPGIALNAAKGSLSGRPSRTGRFAFTLRATDAAGAVADRSLHIQVDEPAPQTFSAAGEVASMTVMSATASADVSGLVEILANMPEGQWVRVNLNLFSDVWTPAELRPLKGLSNPPPSSIIGAWSGYAWDRNSACLWIYGGGHANYSGNDVYRWCAGSRLWERAALPSQIKQDPLGNWIAVDGAHRAPASAHTYDNNIFLPLLNRFLTFGGAAYNNGGPYKLQATETTSRKTGPYLFDPTRADGNKVGGTTGSHVQRVSPHPEIVGGEMWQNRDMYVNLPATTPFPASHIAGCTAYAEEGGRDVVYVGANSGSTALALYRYVIGDLNDPRTDSWTQVGRYWNAGSDQPACAYDDLRKLFVRTGGQTFPFAYWNLNTPGPRNNDVRVTPADPSGEFLPLLSSGTVRIRNCGFDFDPVRRNFVLWCGGGQVWNLEPPAAPVTASGWVIHKVPPPAGGEMPTGDVGSGIIGKWKYIENLDAFMALQGSTPGNIWLYKPVGWRNPGGGGGGNQRPSVSITSPTAGTVVPHGTPITITASASDPDGSIASVEFFNGTTSLGTDTTEPFSIVWNGAPPGDASLMALARDNSGAQTLSASVPITVQTAPSGSLVLQDGLNGYALTRDTYLSVYHTGLNFGTRDRFVNQRDYYTDLVRFAIFNYEGGPVPDAADIQSATLSFYKWGPYDSIFNLHRMLKSWDETTATWNQRSPGVGWTTPGAAALDSDYRSAPDAQASIGWDPGWLEFDVTTAVREMASARVNHGWRLRGVGGNLSNSKVFHSREFATDPSLRPKLTIIYTTP